MVVVLWRELIVKEIVSYEKDNIYILIILKRRKFEVNI